MSELKICPFCGEELEVHCTNRYYMHKINGCILQHFCFEAEDELSIDLWNTRKPMQNIVERLEEENYRKDGGELFLNHNLEDCIPMKRVYEIVKEEGELHEI